MLKYDHAERVTPRDAMEHAYFRPVRDFHARCLPKRRHRWHHWLSNKDISWRVHGRSYWFFPLGGVSSKPTHDELESQKDPEGLRKEILKTLFGLGGQLRAETVFQDPLADN